MNPGLADLFIVVTAGLIIIGVVCELWRRSIEQLDDEREERERRQIVNRLRQRGDA